MVLAIGLELPCVIADTSDGGMRVRLDRIMTLPATITLIDIGAGLAIEAQTAWRQGTETGLKRVSQASLRGLVPSRLAAARAAWIRAGGR